MNKVIYSVTYLVILMRALTCGFAFAEWSSPVDIFTAPYVDYPVVGIDASGNAVMIATVSDDGETFYTKAAQLEQGVPQNIQDLPLLGNSAGMKAISVNDAGNAAAAWLEEDKETKHLFFRGATFINHQWEDLGDLSDRKNIYVDYLLKPYIYFSSTNQALSCWLGSDENNYHVQWNHFFPHWQGPQNISSSQYYMPLGFAGSPSGKALTLWYKDGLVLQGAYYDGTSWSITDVSTDLISSVLKEPIISMNASDHAIVLWYNRSKKGISSIDFFNGVYSNQQSLYSSSKDEYIQIANVAMNEAGEAMAVWIVVSEVTGVRTLLASHYSNGIWNAPVILDEIGRGLGDSAGFYYLNIGIDNQGDTYVVWKRANQAHKGSIYYTKYTAESESWEAVPICLSPSGIEATQPKLSMNRLGDATVVWSLGEEGNQQTLQAVYKKH